ncbi:MAG: DNA polymerase III subunit beta [Deltaproteobacteria bacterium]|nr:DNA polymerase III subunit beta [Deltaproteobacteria bacterium]
MQFTIRTSDLVKGLRWVQGVVERKTTMPALMNVLISTTGKDTAEFTATDLSISLSGRVPAKVAKAGKVVVSAKRMYEIANLLPEGDTIVERQENNWALLKCGKVQFKLVGVQVEEFPSVVKPTGMKMYRIKVKNLERMISKTLYAVSTDEVRRNLNGVYVETLEGRKVRMVATDGHRLAMIDSDLGGDEVPDIEGVIVPRKGFAEFRKVVSEGGDEADIGFQPNQIVLDAKEVMITAKLVEGKFPDYSQVIPKDNNKTLIVKRNTLLDALKRMSILSVERSYIVMMAVKKGEARISSTDPNAGEASEEIEVDYGGPDMDIGLNARYVTEALLTMDSENIRLEMGDELSAVLIKPASVEEHLCVVMPVRL